VILIFTVSAWIRLIGMEGVGAGVVRSFAFSFLVEGDSNHVQPFVFVYDNSLALSTTFAQSFLQVDLNENVWSYWTKFTTTLEATGSQSLLSVFLNDTLSYSANVTKTQLRWNDNAMLILGAYALGPITLIDQERFLGWIDDLCFYNRSLKSDEVAMNWDQAPDIDDPTLVLYYDFNEGPGAEIFHNRGSGGNVADLYSGRVGGGMFYYDSSDNEIKDTKAAKAVSR
jgi:hypothetical protein